MRILHVTSELFPLAKTGGLADVCASLPLALRNLGIDARVLLPAYRGVLSSLRHPQLEACYDGLLGQDHVRVYAGTSWETDLPVWVVDCPSLYEREGNLYVDSEGTEWRDNGLRFALLNHIAVRLVRDIWTPDLVHAHDWHAGLTPLLLRAADGNRPTTFFTIHNLAYQGLFLTENAVQFGLPDIQEITAYTEFYGKFSFLKAGISSADWLTTVSPGYAREIITPAYGCGLEGLLYERRARLRGIMNGIDDRLWNPAQDGFLERPFSDRDMGGKHVAKRALQKEFLLEAHDEVPLAIFMSRLDHQKMPDIVAQTLPSLLAAQPLQVLLIGEGNSSYHEEFDALARKFSTQVRFCGHYEESLAHRALAGADILMHPARYEPCGLTPLYAMRYGALPVVRDCGGMSDSVIDVTPATIQNRSACGFKFDQPNASDFGGAMQRAISLFSQTLQWRKVQSAAMKRDFGWSSSARTYIELYRQSLGWTDYGETAVEASKPISISA